MADHRLCHLEPLGLVRRVLDLAQAARNRSHGRFRFVRLECDRKTGRGVPLPCVTSFCACAANTAAAGATGGSGPGSRIFSGPSAKPTTTILDRFPAISGWYPVARERGPFAPPCPGCGQIGRRNQCGRVDKKYRCVNMSCGVLMYSFADAIEGERERASARISGSAEPVRSALADSLPQKQVQTVLALNSAPAPCTTKNSGAAAGAVATNRDGEGSNGQKEVA